jgi:hypothetical protein
MGVMSEVAIGGEGDAEKNGNSLPSKELGGVDLSGADAVKLGTLHEIVLGIDHDYDLAFAASEDGPWVFKFQNSLVAALAALDQARQLDIASR